MKPITPLVALVAILPGLAHGAADKNVKQPGAAPKAGARASAASGALELVKLLEVTAPIEEGLKQMWADATKDGAPVPEGKTLEDFRRAMAPRTAEFNRAVAKIYEDGLTPDEIDRLVEFLRTPLGEKLRHGIGDERIATLSEAFLGAIATELATYLGGAAASTR